jgi:hypothetical protein
MADIRYPDFICIGAQKAGTTWLDRNLRNHPEIWLPPVKEVQYFNDLYVPASRKWTGRYRKERGSTVFAHHLKNTPRGSWDYRFLARTADIIAGPISDEWYGRIFTGAQQNQICGEITPDYCTLPGEGIEHILKLAPEVKIIFSMRDPIERSWSHIRMLLRNRNTTSLEEAERFAVNPDIFQRADYPTIIANWRKHVAKERFLVIFMDNIGENPNKVLRRVCDFLGASYNHQFFKASDNPIHVGETQEMPPSVEAILKEKLLPIYEKFAVLYPKVGEAWMARHYS